MKSKTRDIKERTKKIKLLLMDVDGVLTPGHMIIADSGREIKVFDVHDGFGIMLWQKAGLKSAIVTAGRSPAVLRRAACLNIDRVYQGVKNKAATYEKIKKSFNLDDEHICFIGDDLIDIPVLKRAGFSCSVANGHQDIKRYVHYQCKLYGGKGAVREVIDMILKIKGLWPGVTKAYLR
jgi:3-deoxy-D-manno-octulosonate 8-phosphate phosphatase (KDO 8-P phosphatase)